MSGAAAIRGVARVPAGTAVVLAIVAVASLAALAAWGASPAGRFLEHHPAHGLDDPVALTLGAFALAWLLMTTATMLPTAAPFIGAFAEMTVQRPNRAALTWSLVAGFTLLWTITGVIAGIADVAGHWTVDHTSLHHHPRLLAASGVALAGAYQLSPLAGRCARACRSPLSFFARYWTGGPDVKRQAMRAGAAYGVSCLGCCAALMVVMLLVGMGNVGWMLGLAVIAAAQKHAPFGDRLRVSIGLVLIAVAVVIVAVAVGNS